jgi:hypothetical protein
MMQEEIRDRARVAVWGAVALRREGDVSCRGVEAQRGACLANTGWTDIARAASLAVRRAKAAARKFFVEGGFAVEAPVQGTEPGPPEHETAKQAARRAMFEKQAKRAGKEFLGNWYPRGADGKNADPRIGVSTAEAPYGYVEGTTTPRTEPLYDQFGRPTHDWIGTRSARNVCSTTNNPENPVNPVNEERFGTQRLCCVSVIHSQMEEITSGKRGGGLLCKILFNSVNLAPPARQDETQNQTHSGLSVSGSVSSPPAGSRNRPRNRRRGRGRYRNRYRTCNRCRPRLTIL